MQVLVDAREKLDIDWENPTTSHAANQAILFHSSSELDTDTFRQYAPYINRLWQDRAIKKAYDRRREFQLVSKFFTFPFSTSFRQQIIRLLIYVSRLLTLSIFIIVILERFCQLLF